MSELATTADLALYQAGDPALMVDAAEAVVRAHCGWHIAPSRTETITLVGSSASALFLPSLHVTAVTSVTEDGTVLDLADVLVSDAGVLTRLPGVSWTTPDKTVAVNYTHGYAEVPADVKLIVLSLASRLPSTGVTREQAGPFVVQSEQQLTPIEMSTLAAYRIPRST